MFGTQTGGGLFGAPAQNSASLFGTPASSGGLFGAPAASGGLFGAAASSPGLFGSTSVPASSASLFGGAAQGGGGLFGAASSGGGLFGAQSSGGGLFGVQSSGGGLFGAQNSAGGLFGAQSGGGLFGAQSSAGGLFGAQSSAGGLFGAQSSGGGLFGAQSGGGLFGAQSSAGGLFGAQQGGGGLFAQPLQQQQQQQQASVQTGKHGRPIRHSTTFENLPDGMQQFIKAANEKFRLMRSEGAALAAAMDEPSATLERRELHADLHALRGALAAAEAALAADGEAAASFRARVLDVVRATEETAWQLRVNAARREVATAAGPEQQQQLLTTHRELLSQPTQSPAPFVPHAVDAMLEQLAVLHATKESLAAVVPLDGRGGALTQPAASLEGVPEVLRSLHEYFLHVAARVARARDGAAAARRAHLRSREATGDFFDPFVDAERREAAAAAALDAPPKGGAPAPAAVAAPAPAASGLQLPAGGQPALPALKATASTGAALGAPQLQATGSLNRGKRRTGF